MPSERIQRQIERLLDEAERSMASGDWDVVRLRCEAALVLDPANQDAVSYLTGANQQLETDVASSYAPMAKLEPTPSPPPLPSSFAGGRYQVTAFLGEGAKKTVYQAHDTLLDREVAFALIKTDGLDAAGRERVQREAQALGRLGSQNIVSVFDLGEDDGRPFIVTELFAGGDLEHLILDCPDHRLPLARLLELSTGVSRGLAFAHQHGVVHRDLKPSNVLLAADGTPKLADFGLAVAVDQSRLTQAGMIVGTAAYIAPEQAMGGEVTPRSDLYSLGCLLYELVTGRPPFVGDESVAIIGQHLHASPVAPSWHRPDCPRSLEALILRLLEKDPGKRPTTAAQVVEALASISPTAQHGSSEAARAAARESSSQSPVYRRIFVGREQELRQLEAAFDAAQSGQGALAMVVGEPGIGKTTLTEQLATYATLRGGKTLVGHCYEEGSLSLPYLPFVEALRTYVLDRDPDKLRSELGSNGPEIARIVSEVRDRATVEPAGPSADAGEDRYRLLQAVNGFLRSAASVQPLVLVLEDLHDADRGTLDLLTFVARSLSGSRLLIVGTYRDIEVDRAHPLSATLAELRRASTFSRVLLRGLTADEVQRMLTAIAGQEVSWGLAEGVHKQTEGNPLFVQEVMRYLAEEGLIKRDGGHWRPSGETPLLNSIPEGLRDVIGRRLARLSPQCNQVLGIAAVIGRDFEFETLRTVAGLGEEELVGSLEEAIRVAVLQDQSRGGLARYRFAHAFFRQTLYEETIAPRRIRMHQQVARALEQQYAGRLEEHATELAEHFAYSSDPADLAKAVEYGELAARRARSVFAHSEAVGHLERCLQVQELADPADKARRLRLLMALGFALLQAGQPLRAIEEAGPEAFRTAEELGDRRQASRAAQLVLAAFTNYGGGVGTPHWREWAERADRYAEPDTTERLYADISLSYGMLVISAEARALRAHALELARRLGNAEAFFFAGWLVTGHASPSEREQTFQLAEELMQWPRERVRPLTLARMLLHVATVRLQRGDRQLAEQILAENVETITRAHVRLLTWHVHLRDLILAQLDGRLGDAIEAAERAESALTDAGAASGDQWLFFASVAARSLNHLGRHDDAVTTIGRIRTDTGLLPVRQTSDSACLALAGRTEAALEVVEELKRSGLIGSLSPLLSNQMVGPALEATTLLRDIEATRTLLEVAAPMAADAVVWWFNTACPARLLADAAAVVGQRERARGYYEQALKTAAMLPNRPELALTRLNYAEFLLVEETDATRAEADQLLRVALPEFEAMGMQPALERARRLLHHGTPGADGPAAGAETPAPAASLPQVFISYASSDRPHAVALAQKLETAGTSVWLDRRNIAGGKSWDAEIVRGIKASGVVAVLVSPAAMQSPNVQQELRLALQYRKPLLPLLLEQAEFPEEVEYALAGRQHIELLDRPEGEWLPQVLRALERLR